jgi:hypothetical protein
MSPTSVVKGVLDGDSEADMLWEALGDLLREMLGDALGELDINSEGGTLGDSE